VRWAVGNFDDLVFASHVAFFENTEVKAGSVMRHEKRRHTRFVHADADAVTGDAGLGDLEESGADAIAVADADLVIGEAFDCEVFAELTEGEVISAELLFPVAIGFGLIDEDGALLASVACEIALAVAVDVETANQAAALNRSLPDRGVD
jgi:hypothetical protein